MAEHSVDYEPEEISDEELAQKKAQLEAEIEERGLETEGEGLVYHGAYEDVKVQKAVTSKGEADNVKQGYWICSRHGCHWLNKAESKRCEVCGAVNPAIEPFVSKYW